VRARRPLRRQVEHPRTERCEHALDRLLGLVSRVPGGVHRVEIRAHRRHRLAVVMAAQALHHRPMRHPDAEQKSAVRLLIQATLAICHRHRVARIDIRDAGRHDQPPRIGEQPGRVRERVPPAALRDPQRGVTPFLDALGERRCRRRGHTVHRNPNSELSQLHRSSLLGG
jgi:hypothetical protein